QTYTKRVAGRPIGSFATISRGCSTLGARFNANAKPAAKSTTALTFALITTNRGMGRGPRISVSRLSSASASHVATATRAMTTIDHVIRRRRSSNATTAVHPGDWNGRKRYFIESSTLTNNPDVTSAA